MIRFLVNIDDAMSESSIGKPAGIKSESELSDAELFYPELAKRDAIARKMMDNR